MNLLSLMKQRCSVRKFEDRPIEREKLLYILEAARIAPSACNIQPWQFHVLEDRKRIRKIAPVWVTEARAPTVIVACGDHRRAWRRRDGKDHCDIDIAIAVDHLILAAQEMGLGTCWICAFDPLQCAITLDLADQVEPIVLIPIGYPAESKDANRHVRDRKSIDEIVFWH